ncbi:uncharacterized protein LOC113280238 [Papaver somniferum]|uniref:uncharacterized protein LOC113280238 n=1 Tax=Papaver somniferum TaxID=3469 RepID=UPI000E6F4860|nr:uncharacterized protein LOC113280238 [Papaver somniferum]
MDTRDPRRTLRGHAKETKRKKSALQIDLNDTPPAEIKAAAALVECIQQGGGRSGILLQPLAPPPLTIDLEAIDDEVVISSPRSFAEARRNKARRNLEILITAERPATPPPPRDRVLMLPLTPVSMRLASRHVSVLQVQCQLKTSHFEEKVCCEACGNAPGCAPISLPNEAAFSCPVCMSSLVEPTSTKWGHIFCKHMDCRRISIHRAFISTKINEY